MENSSKSPSSRGLGHCPFTAATGVRIPLGTPFFLENQQVSANFRAKWVICNGGSNPLGDATLTRSMLDGLVQRSAQPRNGIFAEHGYPTEIISHALAVAFKLVSADFIGALGTLVELIWVCHR